MARLSGKTVMAYHFQYIIAYSHNEMEQAYYYRIIRVLNDKIVALFLAYIIEN